MSYYQSLPNENSSGGGKTVLATYSYVGSMSMGAYFNGLAQNIKKTDLDALSLDEFMSLKLLFEDRGRNNCYVYNIIIRTKQPTYYSMSFYGKQHDKSASFVIYEAGNNSGSGGDTTSSYGSAYCELYY